MAKRASAVGSIPRAHRATSTWAVDSLLLATPAISANEPSDFCMVLSQVSALSTAAFTASLVL